MTTDVSSLLPALTIAPGCSDCGSCGQAVSTETVQGVGVCSDCAAQIRAYQAEERRSANRERYYQLRGAGLLRENFLSAGFGRNASEKEALNMDAWAAARGWRGRENVYLYGPVGTGKSFMALCLLQRQFLRGARVGEVSARRFVKASDRFDEGGMMDAWKRVGVLLVDDVDKATWSSERLAAFWELLDERMVAGRRTILTANVAAKDLREMLRAQAVTGGMGNNSLADATLDRMKPALTIELSGRSLR